MHFTPLHAARDLFLFCSPSPLQSLSLCRSFFDGYFSSALLVRFLVWCSLRTRGKEDAEKEKKERRGRRVEGEKRQGDLCLAQKEKKKGKK